MNAEWNKYLDEALSKVEVEMREEEKIQSVNVAFIDGTSTCFHDVYTCKTMDENPDLLMIVENDDVKTMTVIPLSSIKYFVYKEVRADEM